MLEVRLIGGFDIQCDGKAISISSRAAQSLFAYLILTAGTLHRREKLAGMLWPDESEQKARTFLRNELWRIRKALPQSPKAEYFLTDNLTIGFNPASPYSLDVATLKNLSDNATTEELIRALSNCQGELLPGFYEDWVVLEREHLQVLYEQKIACLLEILEKERRWHDILEWAERWISLAQESEAGYRALMIAYDALGEHGKVTSTYQRCVQLLRDLGLEPSEQTRALAFKRNSRIKIPVPLTSFIGRDKEIKEVAVLFLKSRLITLTGSGGVGKTRLAIQVVADILEMFPDGVWFLDLGTLNDPALVPNALANLLKLHISGNPGLSITELLIDYLHSRTTLVIFDNCEHLIKSCAQLVHSLLTSCEHLSILATSREAMRVSGELPYRVPSLAFLGPDVIFTIDQISANESVRLFVERAAVALPGFRINPQNGYAVAQICSRLDGIPLAIELAAARTGMLSVQQILTGLDDRFHLLKRGLRSALPRHQTLHGTIEWSYDLLSQQERLLFRRLAVFMGGWTLEAVESICVDVSINRAEILDLLEELMNKSMITTESTQHETRYRMLETMRHYAINKLVEADETHTFHDKHLEYFLSLAETAEPFLTRTEQLEWLERLDNDYENLRTALKWAVDKNTPEYSLRFCAALGKYWEIRFQSKEGSNWLERALSKSSQNPGNAEKAARTKALYQNSMLANESDDLERMVTSAELSLKLAQEGQDKRDIAIARLYAGMAMWRRGNSEHAIALMEQSFAEFRELNDPYWQAYSYRWLSDQLVSEGNLQIPERNMKYLALARNAGDRLLVASSLLDYSRQLLRSERVDEAMTCAEESDSLFKQMGWLHNDSSFLLAEIVWWGGDIEKARLLLMRHQEELGIQGDVYRRSDVIADLGLLAMEAGNFDVAEEYFDLALKTAKELEDRIFISWRLAELANIQYLRNNIEGFKAKIRESVFLAKGIPDSWKIHPLILIMRAIYIKEANLSAYILGAVDAFFQKLGHQLFDPMAIGRYYYIAESHVHKLLGDDSFKFAFAEGQKMSLDEVLDLALKTVEEL